MTMTEPAGAVSTKCSESFVAVSFDDSTILTVYAGPHILASDEVADGEIIWMSGMCPPWGKPNLRSASDISQLEYRDNFVLLDVVDMLQSRKLTRSAERSLIPRPATSHARRKANLALT